MAVLCGWLGILGKITTNSRTAIFVCAQELGRYRDETLRLIAHELVDTTRRNVTIDWTASVNVRAKLRVMVKCNLRKYGYPSGRQV